MNNPPFLQRRKVISLLVLLLILLSLLVAVYVIKQVVPTTLQPAVSTPSPTTLQSYPANIDFEPQGYGTYNLNALNNPTISGVDLNMNWSVVEPQKGVFNWKPADDEIAAWVSRSKKFTLIVRYANQSGITTGRDCNIPQYLPSWEIARITHFCDIDRRTIIPNYFDATFKADLKEYVTAIADHFNSSPFGKNLLYVRVGLGLAGEGFPLMRCFGDGCSQSDFAADKSKLTAFGYSPQAWKAWQEELLTSFKRVFSYTTVIYPINQLEIDPTTGQPVQMEVAYWAAANGLGVGQQGLVPGYTYAQIRTILVYIQARYPQTYIQFQTVAPVADARELQGDINTASEYGAKSIEWYTDDAANSQYQTLFRQWQQAVDSKFSNKVGK